MSRFAKTASQRLLAGGLSAALLCAGAALSPAQEEARTKAGPPDLSAGDAGWVTIGTDWIAVPGSPPPHSGRGTARVAPPPKAA